MLYPVPPEFDIKEPIKHKTFLINGKIGSWKGEFSEVNSTILSSKKNIPYKLIGYSPKMDEKHALKALEAANKACLLYTSPSPRDRTRSRMPSSA